MLKKTAAILVLALASACASSRNLDASVTDIGAEGQLKAVLFADRKHDYADIDMTIFEGRLLLTGTMRSDDGRQRLIDNAWKAGGVDQVIDEIVVGDKTPFGQGVEDARIEAALRSKLVFEGGVRSSNYKIAVSNGVVYLLGATLSERSLGEAIELARSTGGVEKVVSHVLIKAP
jgi:osmotically-inducible protein OsmY